MENRNTDLDWEYFGKHDPYWAVITHDRFHKQNLDNKAIQDFFKSGEEYIDWVWEKIRGHLDEQFAPRRALDFGCGVGRLVIPLARRCALVVGIDVSDSMLQEARDNCKEQGLDNVSLVKSDDHLSGVTGTFDFVNSYIVLQHIPCLRGQQIFQHLVALLNDGGVGAIHVTYSKAMFSTYADFDGSVWPPQPMHEDGFWYHLAGLRRAVRRRLTRAWLRGAQQDVGARQQRHLQEQPATPAMQMNAYLLNTLFHALQVAGIYHIYSEFTDHGGEYGILLFFKKQPNTPYRA
jgi:SAM-dependent methyltransferase